MRCGIDQGKSGRYSCGMRCIGDEVSMTLGTGFQAWTPSHAGLRKRARLCVCVGNPCRGPGATQGVYRGAAAEWLIHDIHDIHHGHQQQKQQAFAARQSATGSGQVACGHRRLIRLDGCGKAVGLGQSLAKCCFFRHGGAPASVSQISLTSLSPPSAATTMLSQTSQRTAQVRHCPHWPAAALLTRRFRCSCGARSLLDAGPPWLHEVRTHPYPISHIPYTHLHRYIATPTNI